MVRFGYSNNFILKIEQLLVQYLYQTKQVKLQGIGVFKLKQDVVLSAEGEKDNTAFSFEYNLKTTEDEMLVDYIVQETRKIKPLASSDLESYAILAKQFLNLGKPFYIEGVGTIQKNQLGHYEFIPGNFVSPKIGDGMKQPKDRKEENVSFETESVVNNKGRNLMIGLSTAGIILVGLTLYYFVVLKNDSIPEQTEQNTANKNTAVNYKTTKAPDTNGKKTIETNDTTNKIAVTPVNTKPIDSNGFKIVLKEYPTLKAVQMAYSKLTEYGHKVKIITIDSTRYKLVLSFTRPLKDTSRVKDSIKQFFGGKPYIERN